MRHIFFWLDASYLVAFTVHTLYTNTNDTIIIIDSTSIITIIIITIIDIIIVLLVLLLLLLISIIVVIITITTNRTPRSSLSSPSSAFRTTKTGSKRCLVENEGCHGNLNLRVGSGWVVSWDPSLALHI